MSSVGEQDAKKTTSNAEMSPTRQRLPEWLRANLPAGSGLIQFTKTRAAVEGGQLNTVCEEARCPNIHDCWARGTATFMIAGKECTRGCRFCSVETLKNPELPDADEPDRLAGAVRDMGLRHVVITVVDRDDLADGGAGHYRQCVLAVHRQAPEVTIELLSSDLGGNFAALDRLLSDLPLAVFAHNVECVPRLDSTVRDPRASFQQSLEVLARSKAFRPDLYTKSSLMIGLGETDAEVSDAMYRLRGTDVDILTLGQYIAPGRPGERFLPVDRYVPPDQFLQWKAEAQKLGFKAVASAPMVRSSYRAGALLAEAKGEQPSAPQTQERPVPNQFSDQDTHVQVAVRSEALVASADQLRRDDSAPRTLG